MRHSLCRVAVESVHGAGLVSGWFLVVVVAGGDDGFDVFLDVSFVIVDKVEGDHHHHSLRFRKGFRVPNVRTLLGRESEVLPVVRFSNSVERERFDRMGLRKHWSL